MNSLLELDTTLFRWINNHHCTFCDWFFWIFTQHWSQMVVVALAFLWILYKNEAKDWWMILIGIGLCFLLADQISNLIKDWVMRPRPCYALEDVRMFKTHRGSQYGFVSSHATNCMTVMLYLSLVAHKYSKGSSLPYLLLTWSLIVCYSRPYLGKHYPGDIICGALLGLLIGWGTYWLFTKSLSFLERRKQLKAE